MAQVKLSAVFPYFVGVEQDGEIVPLRGDGAAFGLFYQTAEAAREYKDRRIEDFPHLRGELDVYRITNFEAVKLE